MDFDPNIRQGSCGVLILVVLVTGGMYLWLGRETTNIIIGILWGLGCIGAFFEPA